MAGELDGGAGGVDVAGLVDEVAAEFDVPVEGERAAVLGDGQVVQFAVAALGGNGLVGVAVDHQGGRSADAGVYGGDVAADVNLAAVEVAGGIEGEVAVDVQRADDVGVA